MAPVNTKKQLEDSKGNVFITTADLEKNKESIPNIYDGYILSLFQKGFEKNPIETLKIFNIRYEDSDVNRIAIAEDPLIKEGLFKAQNIDDVKNLIGERISKFNALKGKTMVHILDTEIDIFKAGEFISLKDANDRISRFNFDLRNDDVSQSVTFGLHVKDKSKWKYGVSRFDVKDIYAEDLIDFIDKTMDRNIYAICQKEIEDSGKTRTKKEKSQEEKSK